MAALLAVVAFSAGTVRAQDEPSEPDYVSSDFAIGPGQWVSMDGTTTIAQDGTWMAVGTNGDVWIVTTPASDPDFTFLGYLSAEQIAAAQQPPAEQTAAAQQPVGPPPPVGPANPRPAAPPPGAPPLPAPQIPGNPQTDPLPFGALGGGPIIPDPNRIPAVYPVGPGGMQFVVPAGPGALPPYYMIPIYPDGEIRLDPRPGGRWAFGYVLPSW